MTLAQGLECVPYSHRKALPNEVSIHCSLLTQTSGSNHLVCSSLKINRTSSIRNLQGLRWKGHHQCGLFPPEA